MADSVKIRITGDDAPFKRTLGGLGSATASILKGLSGATVAVKAVWAAVGAVGTQYNATIESLTTSFEVMTGSAEKAAGITERLRNIGAKTPFDLKGLASTTKLLMNYGFEANRAVDEMMMLGDIAQGNAEAMNSIAMGYAQMSSLGKVNLQDIKQMINGGFNPLQEISERTGESMEKLYGRISKGTMKVSEITESMKHATSEGGKYYQSMEKQAQTFQGRLDTLKEDATAFAGQLMTSASDGLRDTVIPMATDLLGEFSAAFERGGLDGLIDAATAKIPMLLDVVMSTMKKGFSGLVKWLPGAMKQIATAIPGALRTVVDLSPQIVDAMFEIATSLVADLLTMLPELVPMILEGLGKMLASVGLGLIRMAGGIIDSVVGLFFTTADEAWTALQKGMDRDVLAGMSAKINAKIDVSAAETAITGAYDVLRKALKTDLLTEEQVAEIEKMIGDDYDKVYAKLKSFGLSDEDAKPIAEKVAEAGKTVTAELEKLNLKVKPGTVLKWMRDANGNRVKLRASLKKAGLTPEDIESILKVYEKMGTDLVDGAPNLADEVYKALTDGKPDDKGALKALNDTELGKNLKAVEDWLTEELAKLNTDSADYPAKVSELKEQA
ncbi:MAG: tape measure protein, partial [Christensenellaceae bacterium]|nr:tape measure protein [Christensenellaceae bacterium]